jgi:RNA polymerase sigma factor (sigma-70 family)
MPTLKLDAAVAAVLAGDQGAYRGVIEACEGRVRAVVAAVLVDRDQIDDCVQQVFVAAYARLGERRSGSDVTAWITDAARQVALDRRHGWLRQEGLRRGYRSELEAALEAETAARAERAGEVVDALGGCLGGLEAQAREVIEEHYWQGLSPAEIARARDRSDAWSRVVLFRAREALVACLRGKGILGGR